MDWKNHLIISVIISIIYAVLTHIYLGFFEITFFNIIFFIFIILVSGLAPDLDHQSGKLGVIIRGFSWLISAIGVLIMLVNINNILWKRFIIFGVSLGGVTFYTGQLSTHRGFIHSILSCLIYGFIIFLFSGIDFALLGIVGYYSHLVADGISFKMK